MTAAPKLSDQALLASSLGDLRSLSAAMMILAGYAPKSMTLAQVTFFLLAAEADICGRATTFTAIKDAAGGPIGRSLHTTYKVLLDGAQRSDGKSAPHGLKWLTRVSNPQDEREKFLELTPKGREVLNQVINAIRRAQTS